MKTEAELISLKERIVVCGMFESDEVRWLLELINGAALTGDLGELVAVDAPNTIDPRETVALTNQFLRIIRDHYFIAGPAKQERVFQVLNALAVVVEIVLRATDHDPKAVGFFNDARARNRME